MKNDHPQSHSYRNDNEYGETGPAVLSQTQSPLYIPTETRKRSYLGRNITEAEIKSKIPKFDIYDIDSP